MKPPKPEESLHQALRAWCIRPEKNPSFRPEVWKRIKARGDASWVAYVRRHLATVSVAAVLTLVLSGWAGRAASRAALHHERETMVVSYLVDLDPRVEVLLRNRAE